MASCKLLQNSYSSLSYTIVLVSVNEAYTVMPKIFFFFLNHCTLGGGGIGPPVMCSIPLYIWGEGDLVWIFLDFCFGGLHMGGTCASLGDTHAALEHTHASLGGIIPLCDEYDSFLEAQVPLWKSTHASLGGTATPNGGIIASRDAKTPFQ